MDVKRIIWASWRVHEDGRVEVIATYSEDGGYAQWRTSYESLTQAANALGAGFEDVVSRALEAGSEAGRWRP